MTVINVSSCYPLCSGKRRFMHLIIEALFMQLFELNI